MGHRRGKKKKFQKQAKKPIQGKIFLFPFLENNKTIDSIKKQFRVMLIMRGIPGSGKSTLVKKIVKIYQNAVICSADDYFIENGQYIWSVERRYYAHQYSMKLAEKCCEMNCPLVIIDNTNITEAEAKFYFQIALKYSYVTILVIPQTPWRFDPVQLEKHGKHNVPLKSLRIKLKLFQDIIPEFYAWFIGHRDAKALTALAVQHFQDCLKYFPQLKVEISKLHLEEQKLDNKQKEYASENHFDSILKESLFCTVMNCSKGRFPGSIDFHSQDHVQSSCGKVFVLQVTKILVTPNFLFCCVELDSQQMTLYRKFETEKCKKRNKENIYKVVGKDTREEQESNDSVLMSSGYTDDDELHQSCLDKVEAQLLLRLSQIKPGMGMDQGNVAAHSSGKSHSVSKEKEADYTKKIEQKLSNENLMNSQVMSTTDAAAAAAAAADSSDGGGGGGGDDDDDNESHFSIGAFRVENKEDCKKEDNVQTEIDDLTSHEEKFATILLTQAKNYNQTDCDEIMEQIFKMEKSKDCKSSERISTDHSDIAYFQNGICIIYLKEKFKIEAIFSGCY